MLNTNTIQSLINSGEGYNVEFKVRVPSKIRELTEEICAFANADGGYLLIGIDDNGQIVGTDLENDKRSAIQGSISEISPALHCGLFTRMHLVERVASGIPRMQNAMKEANLSEPEFHTDGMFTVVFKRGISIKNDTVNDTVNSKEQEVLNIIKHYPELNSSKIAELIGKSVPTAKRYLNSLVKLKMIEFRGAQKTGGYFLLIRGNVK